ncbi:hypothetical protein [Bacillus atrophaeus]|uniref:hypothetical protein n=1 Tax=Bacillus atrophaeus TaxID=1452 RepID=UPI002281AC63|nr:hypothetical protein [Bacillus atrophaeus]MCY8478050.1 hypothetical protein [Bacillus atrophaeus]
MNISARKLAIMYIVSTLCSVIIGWLYFLKDGTFLFDVSISKLVAVFLCIVVTFFLVLLLILHSVNKISLINILSALLISSLSPVCIIGLFGMSLLVTGQAFIIPFLIISVGGAVWLKAMGFR